MRGRIPLVVCLLAALAAAQVHAQEPAAVPGDDYDAEERAWNGLSDLAGLARAEGLDVTTRARVSWEELRPTDVVFVVYPTTYVDPAHVATFLRAGGRMLIADDFGRADEVFARLGLLRRPPKGGGRYLRDNPSLPVARPLLPGHILAAGVTDLHTNHPQVFDVSPGPDEVFGLGGDDVVVVAGTLGQGRFVALADPSLLINSMLAWGDNLQFALNVIGFLRPDAPGGRVILLTGEVDLAGEPKGPADDSDSSITGLLTQLEELLQEANEYIGAEEALKGAAGLLGLCVLVVGAIWIPLIRRSEPDGSFTRVADEGPIYDRLVVDYDVERSDRNFALPAAVLRELAEARLEGAEGERAARLRQELARLPKRSEVLSPGHFVPAAQFLAMKQRVQEVLGDLRRV